VAGENQFPENVAEDLEAVVAEHPKHKSAHGGIFNHFGRVGIAAAAAGFVAVAAVAFFAVVRSRRSNARAYAEMEEVSVDAVVVAEPVEC
jgi:hypothetical protein